MSKMTETIGEKEIRWSQGLPDDILQLIAQRLCISDYQVFRQVCPYWRAAVDRGIATGSCPPAPQLPWLLLFTCHGLARSLDSLHAFYIKHQHSSGPAYLRSEIRSPFSPPYCLGSIGSWLIVAAYQEGHNGHKDTVENYFINPVSRARVMLPSQSTILDFDDNTSPRFLSKIVASSPPASPTRQHNCLVAALGSRGRFLAICRPTDTSWTLIETIDGHILYDIEVIDQKLYVGCMYGPVLLEFDILSEDANVTRAKINCQPYFSVSKWIRYPRLAKDTASKELFIILSLSWMRKRFRVYKMESNTGGEPSCKEVTDLGERTLFLSNKSNKVINDKTLGKNCIYCAYNLDDGYGHGLYSLADRSIERVYFPMGYSSAGCQTILFTPHPW